MVYAVSDVMKTAYPELVDSAERDSKIVHEEERRFAHTVDLGLEKLEELIRAAKADQAVPTAAPRLAGEKAFRLYDTFGLPFDFIMDACRDAGVELDVQGFERAMQEQRERSMASWKGGTKQAASPVYRNLDKTVFEGYRQTESDDCEVLAMVKDGQGVQLLNAGEHGEIVLDHTPFYADSGGQVGDVGVFYNHERNALVAEVTGCYMPVQGVRAHRIIAKQPIHVGMKVDVVVHTDVRQST